MTALTRFADARSVSPRKLMLRAGIGVLAQGWIPGTLQRWQSGTVPQPVELLTRRYPLRLPREVGEKLFSMDEELNLGAADIFYYTLSPEILEQKVLGDKIAFRGNANLHILGKTAEGRLLSQDFPLPFSQFAELRGSFEPDARWMCVYGDNLEVDRRRSPAPSLHPGSAYLVDQTAVVEAVADAYAPDGR